jgi:hypothetical protein
MWRGDPRFEQLILQETHWVIDDKRMWIPIPELYACISEMYPLDLPWLQETLQASELTRLTREMAGACCHPVYQQHPSYIWIEMDSLLQLFATANRGDRQSDTISSSTGVLDNSFQPVR